MNDPDILTLIVLLSIVIFLLFSDGGPGTPRRIRVPIPGDSR
jgi:hypothetical protein